MRARLSPRCMHSNQYSVQVMLAVSVSKSETATSRFEIIGTSLTVVCVCVCVCVCVLCVQREGYDKSGARSGSSSYCSQE